MKRMKKISDKHLKKIFMITACIVISWELIWKKLMMNHPWIFFAWRKRDNIYDLNAFSITYSWIFNIAEIIMYISALILLYRYWKKQENEDTNASDQENDTIE